LHIEINRDLFEKFDFYTKHKVPEYWIIHPDKKTLLTFMFNNKKGYFFGQGVFEQNAKVKVNIFDDLEIDLSQVFE